MWSLDGRPVLHTVFMVTDSNKYGFLFLVFFHILTLLCKKKYAGEDKNHKVPAPILLASLNFEKCQMKPQLCFA